MADVSRRTDTGRPVDAAKLKALAHPLRLELLELLLDEGPATASGLGRAVGESSGTTSYHLRQLAEHGFVEDAGELGNGRERWWRARHRMTSWEAGDLMAQEGGSEVQDEFVRLQLAGHGRVLQAWQAQRDALGPDWAAAGSLNDYALRLTPDQARALAAELTAVADRWLAQHPAAEPAPGTELVSVLLDVVPLQEWPS